MKHEAPKHGESAKQPDSQKSVNDPRQNKTEEPLNKDKGAGLDAEGTHSTRDSRIPLTRHGDPRIGGQKEQQEPRTDELGVAQPSTVASPNVEDDWERLARVKAALGEIADVLRRNPDLAEFAKSAGSTTIPVPRQGDKNKAN